LGDQKRKKWFVTGRGKNENEKWKRLSNGKENGGEKKNDSDEQKREDRREKWEKPFRKRKF